MAETTKTSTSREEQMEAVYKEILDGVQSVMNSDTFRNFLDTNSQLLRNKNYSLNNIMLTYMQRPDASYLMGYEGWKEFGRQVKQGAKGIQILVPYFAYEREKDGFFYSIKNRLKTQLKENPELAVASTAIGKSSLAFTLNRNGIMGWKLNGREMGILTEEQAKRFFDQKVLGKIPVGYRSGTVFDEKDVFIPNRLWIKRGFKKEDMVRDENGTAIKNRKGEYWIENTQERIQKFNPQLNFSIPENDSIKMERLFKILEAVSEERNVSVNLIKRKEDDILDGGAQGYFSRTTDGTPGSIYIADDLSPMEKCSVLLHEMGHADLHNTFAKVVGLSKEMREIQAEATAYVVGKQFGIQTDTNTFQYLTLYASGLEVESLHQSLNAIQKASSSLMLDITTELEKNNLNRQIEPIEQDEPLPQEEVERIIGLTKSVVLDNMDAHDKSFRDLDTIFYSVEGMQQSILMQQKEALNVQEKEGELMLSLCEDLEQATTLEAQMDAVHLIDAAQKRMVSATQEVERLHNEFIKVSAQDSAYMMKYLEDPMEVLQNLQTTTTNETFRNLSEIELQFLVTSPYVCEKILPLLHHQSEAYIEQAVGVINAVREVQAENGCFVEIEHCYGKKEPLFKEGTFLHPKTANKLIKAYEKTESALKKQSTAQRIYYPSSECHLSIMQVSDKVIGVELIMEIGDGIHKDLTDCFNAICGIDEREVEVHAAYLEACKERTKDKQVITNITDESTADKNAREDISAPEESTNRSVLSMSEWQEKMETAREEHVQENNLEKENIQENEPVSL